MSRETRDNDREPCKIVAGRCASWSHDHTGPPDDGDYHGELEAPGQEDWNTPDWAGKGFPSPLRKALRAELARRPGRMATLDELEIFHLGTERRVLIAELARMRDDGEVEFVGPRYRLAVKTGQEA